MQGVTMKSKKVHAAHIDAGTYDYKEEKPKTDKPGIKAVTLQSNSRFSKITDRIADDSMHYINYPVPNGLDLFPLDWRMRVADLFYPHAKGGPLFIDFPTGPAEIAKCKEKMEVLKSKGHRYVYILGQDTEGDVRMRMELGK